MPLGAQAGRFLAFQAQSSWFLARSCSLWAAKCNSRIAAQNPPDSPAPSWGMRIAAPMLLLTAALLIWPCPAAPALEEPEIRPITKAAGARLEIDAVLELPPPPATQRSCSGYRSKCRSQRMRFGTQNIRGLRNKTKMQELRVNMSDRGTACLALQETWHVNDINVSMDDGYRLIGAGNGIRDGNDAVNGVAFMISPLLVPARREKLICN